MENQRTTTDRYKVFDNVMGEVFDETTKKNLKDKLTVMDFFTAPASTNYHGNYEGGLFDHSVLVTMSLVSLTRRLELKWERKESPYVVGMFHDLCKCDQYIKTAEGYAYNNDMWLTGHGEKSVILAQRIYPLTVEEIACIRWHMGAFDEKVNWNRYGKAIEEYNNVLYTHTADMMAARILGV